MQAKTEAELRAALDADWDDAVGAYVLAQRGHAHPYPRDNQDMLEAARTRLYQLAIIRGAGTPTIMAPHATRL